MSQSQQFVTGVFDGESFVFQSEGATIPSVLKYQGDLVYQVDISKSGSLIGHYRSVLKYPKANPRFKPHQVLKSEQGWSQPQPMK